MRRQSSWARLAALILIIGLSAVFAPPSRAWADQPMRLAEQLTDKAGVLGDRRDDAQAALDRLRSEANLQLFVVFVRSFDGIPAQDWTRQTAQLSDLGDRDALLAVATEDRAYAYVFDERIPLSDKQLDDVAADKIEPVLARNDWAGAVIAAADGYRTELTGSGSRLSSFAVICVLVVLAAVAVGVLIWWRSRRRRVPVPAAAGDPNDPYRGVSTQELTDRANTQLLELDDALRTSSRELSMATAQYGAEATSQFTAAVEAARQEVAEAFRLRMLLEDEPPADGRPPTDEAGRRRLLADIIRLSGSADARLDAESAAFDELRELEAHLEQSLRTLADERSAVETRLPAAAAQLATLRSRFTGQALSAVSGNPDQARERLTFAASALQKASGEVAAQHRPAAALAVRAAEQAIDQADTLVAAIATVETDLTAAREAVQTLLAEVESDLTAARSAQGSAGAPPDVRAALASAVTAGEQVLSTARAALAAPTLDPLTVARQLQEADAALDRTLADMRNAADRAARARAMLDQAIVAARAEISAVADFINTRRGAVRERARTLLAEAQRHLSQAIALAADDPATALAEAHQADQLAEQANRTAQSDVDRWAPPGGGFAGPGEAALGGLAGAILGGILMGGGGRGHHGGGFPGGFGGGGGWGGHMPGGFGGSRRSGGGRF